MDVSQVKEKVLKILDDFGISGSKASEAMGITLQTFRNKKNDRPGHSFNEKNYLDLVKFIKLKVSAIDELNAIRLIHVVTVNIGIFVKEYKPTGKPLTIQIKLDDGSFNRI